MFSFSYTGRNNAMGASLRTDSLGKLKAVVKGEW
jgi:hypothetical protein